jgi:spore cortex biosynthesis protein YabQ
MNNTYFISPAGYQFFLFAKALLLGFVLGFLLDFYRSLKALINMSFRATFFADLFFWIAVSAISVSVLLVILWGEIHFYAYAGITCGFLVYHFLLSRYLLIFWRRAFHHGGNLGKFLVKGFDRFSGSFKSAGQAIFNMLRRNNDV